MTTFGPFRVEVVETPTLGDRSYVVHDGSVAAVIDPQRDVDRVHALLDRLGLQLVAVLETHVHNDYVTGGLALADASGATYLFGATGRPDLLGPEHADALARHQHASAHRLADLLPDTAAVLPTHGFGSFCAATQTEATASTIGGERRANPVLTQDEQSYVDELLAGLGAFPAYYAHMGPTNAAGPAAPDLSPASPADPAELRRRLEQGEWLVDLRDRTAFAAGHLRGSYNFGIDGGFATYLGWLVAWGTPLTLLGETAADVAEAQRELVRIGIDRPAAQATGGPTDWAVDADDVRSFGRATFADLAQVRHHRPVVVLDVRRDDERAESAVVGSTHVPLHQLLERTDDVPAGEVWVHCAAGYRASIGASLLDAAGRHVVAVDDAWESAPSSGLPLSPGGAASQ